MTVGTDTITVGVELAAGVLVAPAFLADLDRDHDKDLTEAEGRAYADGMRAGLTLRVDDTTMPLAVTGVDLPTYLQAQAGYGILRLTATAPLTAAAGNHTLYFRNDFAPAEPQYQVAVLAPKQSATTIGDQHREHNQQQVRTTFVLPAGGVAAPPPDTGTSGWGVERLLRTVQDPSRSAWVTVTAIALAMLLGALHALTPGHGKTMMAAYLVGSGGRVRDALALGASVTVTHTSSVLIIGAVALLAGRFAVPDVLVPALELTSGALVLVLGLRLLWQRRHAFADAGSHDHSHDHDHSHAHGHEHPQRIARPAGLGSVVALGISGGLVPCPEALGVMILAVGLGHVAVGMLLIASFSAGLAAVLIGIGILLVRARTVATLSGRFRTGTPARWAALLPLISAIVVVVLGAGLIIRTLGAVGGAGP